MIVTGDWLTRPGTQRLFDVYAENGSALFAVGGCVRNDLLGEPVSDIDMASDAPPEQATAFLEDAGFKVIPTGIDHGTITVISDGIPHEITTFRDDVATDGRHAVVAYAASLEEDSARRDFTINALYCDRDGAIRDPQGGLADIAARRVRFIGNAEERIREDYLRSLRFFRFHARYAADGFDAEALAAIAATLDGLDQLSRERVGAELLKLLSVADPGPAIGTMHQTGVLTRILPGADPRALGPFLVCESALNLEPDPVARLATFADENVGPALRLSKAQVTKLQTLREAAMASTPAGELGYRLGQTAALQALALRAAFVEQPPDPRITAEVTKGATANFPLAAKDLQPRFHGRALGEELRKRETHWIASGFSLTKQQLLG